jgi:hypothetical protein
MIKLSSPLDFEDEPNFKKKKLNGKHVEIKNVLVGPNKTN